MVKCQKLKKGFRDFNIVYRLEVVYVGDYGLEVGQNPLGAGANRPHTYPYFVFSKILYKNNVHPTYHNPGKHKFHVTFFSEPSNTLPENHKPNRDISLHIYEEEMRKLPERWFQSQP